MRIPESSFAIPLSKLGKEQMLAKFGERRWVELALQAFELALDVNANPRAVSVNREACLLMVSSLEAVEAFYNTPTWKKREFEEAVHQLYKCAAKLAVFNGEQRGFLTVWEATSYILDTAKAFLASTKFVLTWNAIELSVRLVPSSADGVLYAVAFNTTKEAIRQVSSEFTEIPPNSLGRLERHGLARMVPERHHGAKEVVTVSQEIYRDGANVRYVFEAVDATGQCVALVWGTADYDGDILGQEIHYLPDTPNMRHAVNEALDNCDPDCHAGAFLHALREELGQRFIILSK